MVNFESRVTPRYLTTRFTQKEDRLALSPFTSEHDRLGHLMGQRHSILNDPIIDKSQRFVGGDLQSLGNVINH